MTSQTKMIIITSNEDLIRQFSLNKTSNTQIIDLDQNKSFTSSLTQNNNNLLDLSFLAQLSELNSSNDQVYKRVLDSPQYPRPKSSKVSKKSLDLVCVICGDRAIGFNYDVLSCASCKAFFRRNAQHLPEKMRCLTGQSKCLVSCDTHRKCQRCRLERCFGMGMRKDFILSEEEKQRRRQRIEENRHLTNEHQSTTEHRSSLPLLDTPYLSESLDEIDQLLMDTKDNDENLTIQNGVNSNNTSFETLSAEDWTTIENLISNYSIAFQNFDSCFHSLDASDRSSALATWSEYASEKAFKTIHFFRQIDEFESLNADDRFTLIKYNLLPLSFLQKCLDYNPLTETFRNSSNVDIDPAKRQQFFSLCYGASGIRDTFKNVMSSLSRITEQDSVLIHLILIILLFSKGLSMNEDEPSLNDTLAVHRAQSHYTTLIWKYLLNKQGQDKTCRQFIQLISEISKLQLLTKQMRDYFKAEIQSTDILERIAPLMQTLLNIA